MGRGHPLRVLFWKTHLYGSRLPSGMASKRKFTNTELGISYGLIIGAVVVGMLFALTNDPIYFSYLGFGLVIGLVIGSYLDSKAKKTQ